MISTAALKLALVIDATDTSQDTYLARLEAAAVAFVERATGHYFGPPAPRVEYADAVGQREIWLRDTPSPQTVVTVEIDGAAVDPASFTLRGRRLRHATRWGSPAYPADARISYTAGFAPDAGPADIEQAVVEIVAAAYENRAPGKDSDMSVPERTAALLRSARRMAA